ncbi:MAG: hypothetical protein GY782_08530 [Gammaproteobacteria bacterium]|nr:hypothetical protein [Gammaproteobacteria bacterium]
MLWGIPIVSIIVGTAVVISLLGIRPKDTIGVVLCLVLLLSGCSTLSTISERVIKNPYDRMITDQVIIDRAKRRYLENARELKRLCGIIDECVYGEMHYERNRSETWPIWDNL